MVVLVALYLIYTFVRSTFGDDPTVAVRHGLDLLHAETWLHIDIERSLNHWLSDTPVLAVPACYAYASLHYVVTGGTLVWLFLKRPGNYAAARTTLVVTTLLGLVGFALVPTAPPRMIDGSWIDTMDRYEGWGWWSSAASAPKGLGGITDQFAAMPSLHCAWALWCGWLICRYARRTWVRALGVAYPVLIGFVVIATANHYLLDVLAGAAVLALAGVVAAVFSYAGTEMHPPDPVHAGPRGASAAPAAVQSHPGEDTSDTSGAVNRR